MEEKKFLTREELLAKEDRRYEDIHLPEWGWVKIRSLSASEGLEVQEALSGGDPRRGLFVIFILSVVDENLNLFFPDGPTEHNIELLKPKALSGFSVVQDKALKMNRIGEYAKAQEEAKND